MGPSKVDNFDLQCDLERTLGFEVNIVEADELSRGTRCLYYSLYY